MRTILKAALLLLAAAVISFLPAPRAFASQATSYTYTMDDKGDWGRTQDAYLPDKTITDLGLNAPEDLYIDNDNMMYIADSGNSRIVKYSIDTGSVAGILTYEEMKNPRGVFVTKSGDIYAADPSAKMVFCFDKDFNFIKSYARPDAPSYGDTKYEPLRVSVDNSGNLYIISEGVYNGVIQLAPTGDFLGYFTVNRTKLSMMQLFQSMFFTRAQLANLVARVPTTFSNIFIDDDNIVYTTTMGTHTDGLKKHNTAGGNIFVDQDWTSNEMTDLYVDDQGIIFTSDNSGYINIYSSAGELIFNFGSLAYDYDISGIFSKLPTIAVDHNGDIWTADGDKGYLQSFKPTDYAQMIYNALGLYEEGRYTESLNKWTEVLRLNQMSLLAHDGVGKALLHAERYQESMEHFVVSGNRQFYSEAFWEVRNTWIQERLPAFIGFIIVLWLIFFIIKHFDKKKKVRKARKALIEKILAVPVLGDVLYAFRLPRHPLDRYYDIRVKKKGTVLGATIIYLLFFIIFMLSKTSKAFIYQLQDVEDMDINALVIGFFVIIGLFVICNYLVTSITDGDGNFKQVYMIPAYGILPYMSALLMVTILSYGTTYNETFLLNIILFVGALWTIISIFLGFMTVHDYTFWKTILSLIITLVFMIIAALVALIIIIMWEQLWTFLKTIGEEMARNVLG
jgi:sugar lactone lactonase YvrE